MSTPKTPVTALSELACLAHTVPGVTLRLWSVGGQELLVSYACLGADLDPCRLRAALLAGHGVGVERIEIVAGVAPLGGGVYQRTHPGAAAERWFVSSLDAGTLAAALAACRDVPGFRTVVKPDPELGVSAVCVVAEPGLSAGELDEVAVELLGTVLVEELLHQPLPTSHADKEHT